MAIAHPWTYYVPVASFDQSAWPAFEIMREQHGLHASAIRHAPDGQLRLFPTPKLDTIAIERGQSA